MHFVFERLMKPHDEILGLGSSFWPLVIERPETLPELVDSLGLPLLEDAGIVTYSLIGPTIKAVRSSHLYMVLKFALA